MIPLVMAALVAAAASPVTIAAPSGVVGVQETVVVVAPRAGGQTMTVTFSAPGARTEQGQVTTDAHGAATLAWTPPLPGTWTITAERGRAMTSVVSVPTSTTLTAPSTLVASRPVTYSASVTSLAGSIAPSGTVALVDGSGTVVTTAALTPGSTARSASAALTWTPGTTPRALRAVFTPGTAAFGPSASGFQTPAVGGDPIVTMQFPDTLYVGVPALLQGITGSGVPGGSLAFNQQIDGFTFWIGGSHPVINSLASQLWAPTQSGYVTIGLQFASSDFAVNASSSQPVLIQPAPAPDAITLLANGSVFPSTLAAGTTAALSATSVSGNPVTLAISGPCVISGTALVARAPGTCTVTASSMGNGGSLAASTRSYPMIVTPGPTSASVRR